MRIGGVTKQNITEFPGGVAAVIYVKGCNFKCSYCGSHLLTQPDMLNRTADMSIQIVSDFLRLNRGLISGVVITGGEPTLQNDLPEFLTMVKGLGLKVKIKTNGTNPAMLKRIIDTGLVNYVSMDVKSGFDKEQYEKIAGVNCDKIVGDVLQSVLILKESDVEHEFFTVVLPGIHAPYTIEELESILKGSKYTLQKIHPRENTEMISCLNQAETH
jgi:pyruvate formate lyase activating enzyme